ncbi:MAG: hypothetical protein ACI4JM_03385 [Oscillospiraceae bacterium]
MFELDKAMYDLQEASQAMQNYANDAVVQEQYRAALEIYNHKLQLQVELAHEFLKNHQEINAEIFKDSMMYLDIAIENANVELADSALKLIETMKKSEPEFFKNYYDIMFGKRG